MKTKRGVPAVGLFLLFFVSCRSTSSLPTFKLDPVLTIDGSSDSAVTVCKPAEINGLADALNGSWRYEWSLFIDNNKQNTLGLASQDVNCYLWCVNVRYGHIDASWAQPPSGKYQLRLRATADNLNWRESWSNAIQVNSVAQCPSVTPQERGNLLHVAAVTSDDMLWHTIRHETEFTWAPFRDVRQVAIDQFANPQLIVDVSTAVVAGELHVAVLTEGGRIYHTIRRPVGWQPFRDIHEATGMPVDESTGQEVRLRKVAIAQAVGPAGGEMHLVALDGKGVLWHTIRHSNSWEQFVNATRIIGTQGTAQEVDVAGIGSELHVTVLNEHGKMGHTIRKTSGWDSLGDVSKTNAGDPAFFTSVSTATVDGKLHVAGVTEGGELWHTIRWPTTWDPLRRVTHAPAGLTRVSVGESGGRLHVAVMDHENRLWHTIRNAQSWDPLGFGNVEETNAGERGQFRAMSIDGLRVP